MNDDPGASRGRPRRAGMATEALVISILTREMVPAPPVTTHPDSRPSSAMAQMTGASAALRSCTSPGDRQHLSVRAGLLAAPRPRRVTPAQHRRAAAGNHRGRYGTGNADPPVMAGKAPWPQSRTQTRRGRPGSEPGTATSRTLP